MEELKIGDVVTYRDEVGVEHNALVTAVHGPDCINVAYLSADPAKHDSYGRQVERDSSVQRQSDVTAPNGRYFNS
jgi:hypothetical protein